MAISFGIERRLEMTMRRRWVVGRGMCFCAPLSNKHSALRIKCRPQVCQDLRAISLLIDLLT
ncbi:MAG: hypothetical protein QOH25_3194 [Acidobacteriota bacterium]|nr:hypothetical protein [Acidobacteriota bacterium]